MSNGADDTRIAALEQHAAMGSEGLVQAIDHIRALTIVMATVLAACTEQDRTQIRAAALGGLSETPDDARLRPLIEAVTLEPAASAGNRFASAVATNRIQ